MVESTEESIKNALEEALAERWRTGKSAKSEPKGAADPVRTA